MSQRIRERLNGENKEVLVRAYRTGEYIDQFTTRPKEEPNLERLPKCMQRGKKQ